MNHCSPRCPSPGTHRSYGECLRSKSVSVNGAPNGIDQTKQHHWDAELSAYRGACAEGLQPAGTTMRQIDAAKRAADAGV